MSSVLLFPREGEIVACIQISITQAVKTVLPCLGNDLKRSIPTMCVRKGTANPFSCGPKLHGG